MIIFGLQQLLPGDPALAMAGEEHDPVAIAQIREKYNLNKPLPVRYWLWISGVVRGDLGESIRIQMPVSQRSEEHTSELQSLMRTSYAVFCVKKKKRTYSSNYCTSRNKYPTLNK